ncbi:hypothetical protein FHW79_005985 [Azospirillum sp. OGB3]|uniref:hypothetical protein n=1 Tax=Azospirillum sp. OGB3 TaxID=2587012 RepID=UPI0016059CD0|nr:hypothetical protein [Azospirillum sp. OGB3]MBB3268310.1 hypothetical protein [Azospirillum sp. OGB3]
MKRTAAVLGLGAALVATGAFAYTRHNEMERLRSELGRVQHHVEVLEEKAVPILMAAHRNAAYAYLAANRATFAAMKGEGVFIGLDALKATGLVAPAMDGKVAGRSICLWLTRTHENQWALVTFTNEPSLPFSEEQIEDIAKHLGANTTALRNANWKLRVNEQTEIDMNKPLSNDCRALPAQPINVILLDLRHADLRLQ